MSDSEIRKVLTEHKRLIAEERRRENTIEAIGAFFAFGGMIFIGFMLSVIGG